MTARVIQFREPPPATGDVWLTADGWWLHRVPRCYTGSSGWWLTEAGEYPKPDRERGFAWPSLRSRDFPLTEVTNA